MRKNIHRNVMRKNVRMILATRMLLFLMEEYLGLMEEDSMSVEENLDSFFFVSLIFFDDLKQSVQ